MSEQYSKVEIVTPRPTPESWITKIFAILFILALRVLIVWWLAAAWVPELGLTFWQLVLPVYAARVIFGNNSLTPRLLKK